MLLLFPSRFFPPPSCPHAIFFSCLKACGCYCALPACGSAFRCLASVNLPMHYGSLAALSWALSRVLQSAGVVVAALDPFHYFHRFLAPASTSQRGVVTCRCCDCVAALPCLRARFPLLWCSNPSLKLCFQEQKRKVVFGFG